MRIIIYIFSIFLICSCDGDREKIVEGDLYFKLFDLERYFDGDTILLNIENAVRTINRDTLDGEDLELYDAFKFMVDNNLLRRPYIRLRLDNEDIRILMLDTSD